MAESYRAAKSIHSIQDSTPDGDCEYSYWVWLLSLSLSRALLPCLPLTHLQDKPNISTVQLVGSLIYELLSFFLPTWTVVAALGVSAPKPQPERPRVNSESSPSITPFHVMSGNFSALSPENAYRSIGYESAAFRSAEYQ